MSANKQSPTTFEKWANASFRGLLRFEWTKIQRDPRIAVLWIVEILLAVGIATSIALYLDPDVNVLPAPGNYVAFLILAGAALWIHRLTRPFRLARRIKKGR